jgi:predicted nuclease of predicted toxin-antitoxin system
MKLLLDMNIAPRWVDFLSAQGLEAAHWSNVGAPTAQDSEIMDFARAGGYTVFILIPLGMLYTGRNSGQSIHKPSR